MNWETEEAFSWLMNTSESVYKTAREIAHGPRATTHLRELVRDVLDGQDIDRRKISYRELVQAIREG